MKHAQGSSRPAASPSDGSLQPGGSGGAPAPVPSRPRRAAFRVHTGKTPPRSFMRSPRTPRGTWRGHVSTPRTGGSLFMAGHRPGRLSQRRDTAGSQHVCSAGTSPARPLPHCPLRPPSAHGVPGRTEESSVTRPPGPGTTQCCEPVTGAASYGGGSAPSGHRALRETEPGRCGSPCRCPLTATVPTPRPGSFPVSRLVGSIWMPLLPPQALGSRERTQNLALGAACSKFSKSLRI